MNAKRLISLGGAIAVSLCVAGCSKTNAYRLYSILVEQWASPGHSFGGAVSGAKVAVGYSGAKVMMTEFTDKAGLARFSLPRNPKFLIIEITKSGYDTVQLNVSDPVPHTLQVAVTKTHT